MPDPRSKGRMIRKGVSSSDRIASLSKEAMVLFFMTIPHLDSHGKMNGSAYYVKGEVVPLVEWFTIPLIEKCLQEISEKTNLKWFQYGRLWYLHSLTWEEHQELRKDRLGADELPSYSGVTPTIVPPEVEVEVEVKGEGEVEKNLSPSDDEDGSGNDQEVDYYLTKKKRKLSGKRFDTFLTFWEAFDYKTGKAEAADSWLDIPAMSLSLVTVIVDAAKAEAKSRSDTIRQGKTPKMAQGWLTGRRWEDENGGGNGTGRANDNTGTREASGGKGAYTDDLTEKFCNRPAPGV